MLEIVDIKNLESITIKRLDEGLPFENYLYEVLMVSELKAVVSTSNGIFVIKIYDHKF